MKRLLLYITALAMLICSIHSFAQTDASDSAIDANPDAAVILYDDFDNGSDSLSLWTVDSYKGEGVSYEISSADGLDGTDCLHVISTKDNDARILQTIAVRERSYIKLSCTARTSGTYGGGACISVLSFYDYDTNSDIVTSEEWQETGFYCYTGNYSEITVALRLGYFGMLTHGEAWFDNVKVEYADDTPAYYSSISDKDSNTDTNTAAQQTITPSTDDGMPYFSSMIVAMCITAAVFVVLYVYFIVSKKELNFARTKDAIPAVIVLLAAGLILRILANFLFKSMLGKFGHSTDLDCFTAWGSRLLTVGPGSFYSPDYFADYPPGYMWILGLCEAVRRVLNVPYGSGTSALILKMPCIICDLVCAYIVYREAVKAGRTTRSALVFSALIIFNPLIIFISSVWGQIDMMLSLFTALAFIIFLRGEKKGSYSDMILSGVMYGIAVSLKPQALMLGPVYAIAFIAHFIDKLRAKDKPMTVVYKALAAAFAALAVIIIPALPFTGSQSGLWLIDKYAGTASSYNYATVEAYNLYGLLGANWKDADAAFIGVVTYKQFGTACMVLVIAAAIALYLYGHKKNTGCIFLSGALIISGIFTLGHYMHERYLFPAVILVLFAAIWYNDRRLMAAFFGFVLSMLYNSMCAFIRTDCVLLQQTIEGYQRYVVFGSILTLVAFVLFVYAAASAVFDKNADRHRIFKTL